MITIEKITENGIVKSDVYSNEFSKRRIYLTGQIDDITASYICAQINQLASESDDDIYLIIHSCGGSVPAGISIYDTMNSVVMGEAASMGDFLAAGGAKGKRMISSNSEMMIHQPLGGANGQASDIERTASHIVKTKKKLHRILSKNTGKPYEQISLDCDRDYWLDADEAIEYGLVDKFFEGFDK